MSSHVASILEFLFFEHVGQSLTEELELTTLKCYVVTWGHVTLSAGEYVMSWLIFNSTIVDVKICFYFGSDYNTNLK